MLQFFRIRELIVSCFKPRSLSVFWQASIRWAAVPGHLREMSLVWSTLSLEPWISEPVRKHDHKQSWQSHAHFAMQFQVGCQGDFFVVDQGSAVRFDEQMTLKELWFDVTWVSQTWCLELVQDNETPGVWRRPHQGCPPQRTRSIARKWDFNTWKGQIWTSFFRTAIIFGKREHVWGNSQPWRWASLFVRF